MSVMRHGRHAGTGAAVRVRVVRVLVPVERVVQGCVQRMHHGQHGAQRDRHGVRNAVVQMRRQAQAESHRHGRQWEVGLHRVLVRRGQRVLRVSVSVAVSVRVVAVVRRRMHEVMLWVAQRRAERRGQQRKGSVGRAVHSSSAASVRSVVAAPRIVVARSAVHVLVVGVLGVRIRVPRR